MPALEASGIRRADVVGLPRVRLVRLVGRVEHRGALLAPAAVGKVLEVGLAVRRVVREVERGDRVERLHDVVAVGPRRRRVREADAGGVGPLEELPLVLHLCVDRAGGGAVGARSEPRGLTGAAAREVDVRGRPRVAVDARPAAARAHGPPVLAQGRVGGRRVGEVVEELTAGGRRGSHDRAGRGVRGSDGGGAERHEGERAGEGGCGGDGPGRGGARVRCGSECVGRDHEGLQVGRSAHHGQVMDYVTV